MGDPFDPRTQAVHEAGHAVAAIVYRRGLVRVSIVREADRWGHARMPAYDLARVRDAATEKRRRWVFYRECRILLAGGLAQSMFTGVPAIAGEQTDRDYIDELLLFLFPDVQKASAVFTRLHGQTAAMLVENRAAVERLADALLVEQTISGPRARAIIRG